MQNFSALDDSSNTNANGTTWSGGAVADYATLSDLTDLRDCIETPKGCAPSVSTSIPVSLFGLYRVLAVIAWALASQGSICRRFFSIRAR